MSLRKLACLALCTFSLVVAGCGSSDDDFVLNNGAFNTTNPLGPNNPNNPQPGVSTYTLNFQVTGNAIADVFADGGAGTGWDEPLPSRQAPTRLQAILTSFNLNPPGLRSLTLQINSDAAIAVGDFFPLDDEAGPADVDGAFLDYFEQGQPQLRRWLSTGGGVRVTAINNSGCTVEFEGALLSPAADGDNGASGTITVSGTAALSYPAE